MVIPRRNSVTMTFLLMLVSSSMRMSSALISPLSLQRFRTLRTTASIRQIIILEQRHRLGQQATHPRIIVSGRKSSSSDSNASSAASGAGAGAGSLNESPVINGAGRDRNDATTTNNNESDPLTSNNTTMSMSSTSTNKSYLDGGNSILAIDPADIRISLEPAETLPDLQQPMTTSEQSQNDLLRRLPFVSTFRGSANYIANHRNTVAVYHVPGGLLSDSDTETASVFRDVMNDVALTWLLGMKIIIVVGCRHQIEQRLIKKNAASPSSVAATPSPMPTNENSMLPYGLRVTNAEVLRIVKEEAGYVRFEVERQLARSLRLQGGGTTSTNSVASNGGGNSNGSSHINGGSSFNSSTTWNDSGGGSSMNSNNGANNGSPPDAGYYDGNVVSGNFYSAQPFGILDGVDYQYTGFVRKVEVEKIRQLHSARDICLLTTLGVSPSGEVFNVNSESLAATVAGAMDASKVLYFTEKEIYLRHNVHGNKIQSLRLSDARNLLQYYGVKMNPKGFVTLANGVDEQTRRDTLTPDHMDMLLKIGWCTGAINLGVKRAHIISPQHGSLLQELYTRDGSGTLVSADLYEGIGRATVLDVNAIHTIISPLIQAGTLIDRPKAQLEKDVDSYYIYTRDTHIIACGQLKKFEDGYAEIGCLVVNKDFRSRGRGDAMLGYLERLCLMNGCTNIFVLSTQTMEWFVERGFDEADVSKLPPSRQATYNHKRASKIYIKKIESDRDLDASELWWNR